MIFFTNRRTRTNRRSLRAHQTVALGLVDGSMREEKGSTLAAGVRERPLAAGWSVAPRTS